MENWHKYNNYRKHQNTDGTHTYIITINGTDVEVCEETYAEYAAQGRKIKYMELDIILKNTQC